VFSTA
jgi:hypothetical protein